MAQRTARNVTPFQRGNNVDTSWKSDAFINIWLPTRNGGRRKLGTINLKLSRERDAEVIAYLEEDPSRVAKLFAKATIDFQLAEASEDSAFALDDLETEAAE